MMSREEILNALSEKDEIRARTDEMLYGQFFVELDKRTNRPRRVISMPPFVVERVDYDKFEKYEHHGVDVWTRKYLKGQHKRHCLCYDCKKFKPENREENCSIANILYRLCELTGITSPVYECPEFEEDK